MAAANQQIRNILQNQNVQTQQSLSFTEPIDGIPRADWTTKHLPILNAALAEKRYANLEGLSVAQGTAAGGPNAGGGPPAAGALAIYQSASQNVYGLLMQKVLKSSSLYNDLSEEPFVNNSFLTYSKINHTMQKTTNLETEETNFKKAWDSATMVNSVPLTADGLYKWRDYLVTLNQVPAAYKKTPDEMVKKFTFHCHPKLAAKAMDMYEAHEAVHRIPMVHPGTIFPGGPAHPNAGVAIPNAGQRDIAKYIGPLSARFDHLVEQREIVLQSNVDVLAAQDFEDGYDVDGADPFGGAFHVDYDLNLTESVYSLLEKGYTVAEVQHLNRTSRFPRCFNCGGLNHFARREGKFVCPTPEGSIPKQVLFGISYPMGVVSGGKGKGKGKGKGAGGYGRGRGRGGYRDNDTVNAVLSDSGATRHDVELAHMKRH